MFLTLDAPRTVVQTGWMGHPRQLDRPGREIRRHRLTIVTFLVWRDPSVLDHNHALPSLAPHVEPVKRRLKPPGWQDTATCNGLDEELFFSEDPRLRVGLAVKARQICRACPVIRECMTWALGGNPSGEREGFGIWAASSRRQRLEIFDRLDAGASVADEVEAWLTQIA